jgi:hypothetical protein
VTRDAFLRPPSDPKGLGVVKKNLFFADSDSRTGKARFGGKNKKTPRLDGFCVVFTGFEGGLCPPSNPNQPGKKQGFTF